MAGLQDATNSPAREQIRRHSGSPRVWARVCEGLHNPLESQRLMTRLTWSFLVLATVCACGGGSPMRPAGPDPSPSPPPPPPPLTGLVETVVGAGDIGWCGVPGAELTAALLDRIGGTVIAVGDNAYMSGGRQEYADCYDPWWGRHKGRTRRVPGNHESLTPGAAGYFAYFGASAGPPGQGYYSYREGAWLVVAINSAIATDAASAQAQWLRATLAQRSTRCTAAI